MIEAARAIPDRHVEGYAVAVRGLFEFIAHRSEEGEASCRAALAIAEEGHPDVRMLAASVLGEIYQSHSRISDAETQFRLVEALAPSVTDVLARAIFGTFGFFYRQWQGRADEALEFSRRWRSDIEASGDVTMRLCNRWSEALAIGLRGEYEAALAILLDALGLAERVSDALFKMRILNTIGWVYLELECPDRALEWNRRGLEAAVAAGPGS